MTSKGAYKFLNAAAPGKYLAWEDSWKKDKTNVVVWDGDYDDQYWILRKNMAGYYELVNFQNQVIWNRNIANYKVLDRNNNQTASGTNVGVYKYHGGLNQQWEINSRHPHPAPGKDH